MAGDVVAGCELLEAGGLAVCGGVVVVLCAMADNENANADVVMISICRDLFIDVRSISFAFILVPYLLSTKILARHTISVAI